MAFLQKQGVFQGSLGASLAPRRQSRRTFCSAQKPEQPEHREAAKTVKGIAAAALAASFILASAGTGPAEAARSGGRAGGSSFRSSAPRAAAPRAAPSQGPSVVNKTYNYSSSPSPPLFGGFGGFGGGYGYGYGSPGISFFPSFAVPIGGGGGIFQLFFVAIIASTVLGVIRSVFSGRKRNDYDD